MTFFAKPSMLGISRLIAFISIALSLNGCGGGGGGGSSSTTPLASSVISGVVSDDAIVGATVTVTSLDTGLPLGEAVTGADGSYTLTIPSASLGTGYSLRSSGGTMNGLPFSGSLSASYASGWLAPANLTLTTSALDEAATSTTRYVGNHLQKQDAILANAILRGVLTNDYYLVEPVGTATAAQIQALNAGVAQTVSSNANILNETTGDVPCGPSVTFCKQSNFGGALSMTLAGGTVSAHALAMNNCKVVATYDASLQMLSVRFENVVVNGSVPFQCEGPGNVTLTLTANANPAPDQCPTSTAHLDMRNCVEASSTGFVPSYYVFDDTKNHRSTTSTHTTGVKLQKVVNISRSFGAVLHASLNPSSQDWAGKTPVIFVHGFTPTLFGFGGDIGTWGKLPTLVLENNSLVTLNFQWKTDASYLTVAKELAKAVDYAHSRTNKKVFIVAHSFGGVLSRVMLQNLTGTTGVSAEKVDSLITIGTPHSGIVDADGMTSSDTDALSGLIFPRGWGATIPGSACKQITCYQSGLDAGVAQWAKDELAGMTNVPEKGYITARLANTSTFQFPTGLKVQVLIGQILKKNILGSILGLNDNFKFSSDDGLISYYGQRFYPQGGRNPLLWNSAVGNASITERILGLQLGENAFPGDPAGSLGTTYLKDGGNYEVGYKHSSFLATLLTSSPDAAVKNSEVYVPFNCGDSATCLHDTWLNLRDVLCVSPRVLSNGVCSSPIQASLLTDTGISTSQCYQVGSDVLVSCNSAEAISLNAQQDGMLGRDMSNPSSADGKLGFSFSTVGANTIEECVKDNITGLTWEGKTAIGLRQGNQLYTNLENGQAGDASAYINAVNSLALCGYNDWRLPSEHELQSLVDYGMTGGTTIDVTWFPNTPSSNGYWSSTQYVNNANIAVLVGASDGAVLPSSRSSGSRVRLVR